MKRFVAVISILALMLTLLAGCGGSGEENIGGTVSQGAPAETPAVTPSEEPSAPAEEEAEFDTGVVVGGTYTNEFLGINLTLDNNWVFFSEQQMAELNGLTADLIGDEDIKAMMESSGVVYDLYATSAATGAGINIVIEDLGLVYGTVLSEEAYAEASMGTLQTALESAGLTNVSCEKISVELCGEEHAAIGVSATNLAGYDMYEIIVCYKLGSYMACITCSHDSKDGCLELIDLFYTGEPIYAPVETPAAPAEPSSPAEEIIPSGEFAVGTISGNTYISEFLGIKCELDDNWIMDSSADIAAYNGLSSTEYTTEDALELFANGYAPYEMSAVTFDGYYVIELLLEDLGPLYGATLSAEDYVDMTISMAEESLVAAGVENVVCSKGYVDFCGQKYVAIITEGSLQGIAVYQTMVCFKVGNYMACATLLSLEDNVCDILAGYFSAIN